MLLPLLMVCCSTTARSGLPGVRLRGVGDVVLSEHAAKSSTAPTDTAAVRDNLEIGTRMGTPAWGNSATRTSETSGSGDLTRGRKNLTSARYGTAARSQPPSDAAHSGANQCENERYQVDSDVVSRGKTRYKGD